MTTQTSSSTTAPYTPVPPFTVSANSVLSQDLLATDSVPVDVAAASSALSSPVAAFCNPAKNGAPEALVITQPDSGGPEVQYLAQDPTQSGGWSLTPLSTLLASDYSADPNMFADPQGVLATVSGSQVTLWWISTAGLCQSTLDGSSNPGPITLWGDLVGLSNLGVCYYSPAAGSQGTPPVPVVYGYQASAETLYLLAYAGGQDWAQNTYRLGQPLLSGTGFQMMMTSANNWALYSPKISGTGVLTIADGPDRATLGPWSVGSGLPAPTSVIGISVPPGEGQSPPPCPFYLGTGTPFFQLSANVFSVLPAPTANVVAAVCVPLPTTADSSGMISAYLVDAATDNLSVLRQIGWSNDESLPLWAPPMPIAGNFTNPVTGVTTTGPGVQAVFPSLYPNDPPTLFTIDPEHGYLTLYFQSSAGGYSWSNSQVQLAGAQEYEFSSYLSTVTLIDSHGVPVSDYPLELSASTATGVTVGGQSYLVGPNAGFSQQVYTDASGSVGVSVPAEDLAPSVLTLTDPADPAVSVSFSPAGPIQAFLAPSSQQAEMGYSGSLPYQPQNYQTFGPDVMNAQSPAGSGDLFPGVASGPMSASSAVGNVQSIMAVGNNPPASGGAPGPIAYAPPADGPVGFIINRCNPHRPAYLEFDTSEALRAELFAQQQNMTDLSIFHDIGDAFSDVWQGVKTAATAVASIAVDTARGIVSIAIWIGDEAVQIGDFVITCVEDACNAVMAVFSALEAIVEDVIDFLKALFNLSHMFDTQKAFDTAVEQTLQYAEQTLEYFGNELNSGTGYFAGLESSVNEAFDTLIARYGTQTVSGIAGSGNWQNTNQPPNAVDPLAGTGPTGPGGGPVTPADLAANPQTNWLQAQVAANAPSTTSTGPISTSVTESALSAALGLFGDALNDAESSLADFYQGFAELWDAVGAMFEDFTDGDVVIADLLGACRYFVLGTLELLDALATGFVAVALVIVDFMGDVLNAPLGGLWDVVGELYKMLWKVSGAAGDPPELTIGTLATLLLAFPYTILCELVTGEEPFPGGVPFPGWTPGPRRPEAQATGAPLGYQLVKPIGSLLVGVVGIIQDAMLDEAPGWVGMISIVWSVATWAFAWPTDNGPLSGVPWQTWLERGGIVAAVGAGGGALAALAWVIWRFWFSKETRASFESVYEGALQKVEGRLSQMGGTVAMLKDTLTTIFGVGYWIYELVGVCEGEGDALQDICALVSPLPIVGSFLLIPELIDASGGVSYAAKLILDAAATFSVGVLETLAVIEG